MPARSTDTAGAVAPAGDDYRLDDQVGHLLRRAHQRATANLAARLAPHGLTALQFVVLARLAETGAVSQNRLGRLVAMEPANIHGLVGRLIDRGLVATAPDPDDRRRLLVTPTAAGDRLVRRVRPAAAAATATTLAALAPAERTTLTGLLKRLAFGAA